MMMWKIFHKSADCRLSITLWCIEETARSALHQVNTTGSTQCCELDEIEEKIIIHQNVYQPTVNSTK